MKTLLFGIDCFQTVPPGEREIVDLLALRVPRTEILERSLGNIVSEGCRWFLIPGPLGAGTFVRKED